MLTVEQEGLMPSKSSDLASGPSTTEVENEEDVAEVFDDDGKPYFQPIDWDVLIKKYGRAEEDIPTPSNDV